MVIDEDFTGKGMDSMSNWHQHYYTWSTKSLSNNKVGLGIVAASDTDREIIRIAGTEAASCEVCRSGFGVLVERMRYSSDYQGWIRTGTVPYEQAADRRNNKFVHIFSCEGKADMRPEDYLCELPYKTTWDGNSKLDKINVETKIQGRKLAVSIMKKYGLSHRMNELFYYVYHCIFTPDKPLWIVDKTKDSMSFRDFTREMMILIHYMLPESMRKEADYVSFVNEASQEAHFIFGNTAFGKHIFNMNDENEKIEYYLQEKDFYMQLSESFCKSSNEFEIIIKRFEELRGGLHDKRNQLEKCILSYMSSSISNRLEIEDYYSSMERLMYWARKDKSLLEPLKESVKKLDYQNMKIEELLLYTKFLTTGAGGRTKDYAFSQLFEMVNYYHEQDKSIFERIMNAVRDSHFSIYEEILVNGYEENGFAKELLYAPIDTLDHLEQAVRYQNSFLKDKAYREYVVACGYELYKKEKDREKQDRISRISQKADAAMFVELKRKDVEKVILQAENIERYMELIGRLDLERLEKKIKNYLVQQAEDLMNKREFRSLSEEISLFSYIEASDINEEMKKELCLLLAKRYIQLTEHTDVSPLQNDTENWIYYVLKLSGSISQDEKYLAKQMIQNTKKLLIDQKDLLQLSSANRTLLHHGVAQIHCPETMWEEVTIEAVEDFLCFYKNMKDISLVRCDKSAVYQKLKLLYEYADDCSGCCEERAIEAWKRYEEESNPKNQNTVKERLRKAAYHMLEDILNQSIWAVVLGLYGFLFVSVREKIAILQGYTASVIILVLFLLLYLWKTVFGEKKEETPGTVLYVLGMGVLLMNWGLALDTIAGICILYGLAVLLAVFAKAAYYIILRQRDEDRDED